MKKEMELADPRGAGKVSRRVFAYHEFSTAPSSDVYQLTPIVFRSQLAALHRISLTLQTRIAVTFDDAHASQIEIAVPILEEFTSPGLFFVPAGWVGAKKQTATWEQLRGIIGSGHLIGSHGLTHALLTNCKLLELMTEIRCSRETLEDKLGIPVHAISMPGGRWNRLIAALCYAAGYSELYTSDPAPLTRTIVTQPAGNFQVIGRLVVRRTMSTSTLMRYAAGESFTWAWLASEYRMKEALKKILGDNRYQALWRRLLRSPTHTY